MSRLTNTMEKYIPYIILNKKKQSVNNVDRFEVESSRSGRRSGDSTDHSLSHRTDQRLIIFREFFKENEQLIRCELIAQTM